MEIKTVNDYIDLVYEKYPDVPEAEIKRILVYGFKMILQYVRAGNDVCIRDPKFFFTSQFIKRISCVNNLNNKIFFPVFINGSF